MINLNLKIVEYKLSIQYFLLCLAGVMLFVFLGIIPGYKSLTALNEKTKNLQLEIDKQETLLPIYQKLALKIEHKESNVLPFPARTKLPMEQMDEFFLEFTSLAKKFNMTALSVRPELNSLKENSDFLLVYTVFKGDFLDLRKLLIGLGEVPYLEHIEEIEIKQAETGKEFKMKIWIALG